MSAFSSLLFWDFYGLYSQREPSYARGDIFNSPPAIVVSIAMETNNHSVYSSRSRIIALEEAEIKPIVTETTIELKTVKVAKIIITEVITTEPTMTKTTTTTVASMTCLLVALASHLST